MTRLIYADHNATTPLGTPARDAMHAAMEAWGNPSSSHGVGRKARELLEQARAQVAAACGVPARQVVFTSGGSEANAQCLLGLYFSTPELRLITSDTEHSSVRDATAFLERQGALVHRVRVLPSGEVDLEHLESLLKELRPQVVSLMAANNETGVLLPTQTVRSLCDQYGAWFHCDCVQAFGKVPAEAWNSADLFTVSGHKIYGPKGVGAMVLRADLKLAPIPFGGTQEIKRRGGTENMVGIAGFGAACEAMGPGAEFEQVSTLRDHFETSLVEALPGVHINGGGARRAPNTANLRFEGVLSEVLLSILDLAGVCVSAGSACSSGSISPSPVLLAMGLTKEQASECVRFSWGRETTLEDVDATAQIVIKHVQRIRARS